MSKRKFYSLAISGILFIGGTMVKELPELNQKVNFVVKKRDRIDTFEVTKTGRFRFINGMGVFFVNKSEYYPVSMVNSWSAA